MTTQLTKIWWDGEKAIIEPLTEYEIYKIKQVRADVLALWPAGEYKLYASPPPRPWVGLTDEDRQAAFESMPDMLDGFLKTWGWLHFAKALEKIMMEKNA
jgi:hypothetical protein